MLRVLVCRFAPVGSRVVSTGPQNLEPVRLCEQGRVERLTTFSLLTGLRYREGQKFFSPEMRMVSEGSNLTPSLYHVTLGIG